MGIDGAVFMESLPLWIWAGILVLIMVLMFSFLMKPHEGTSIWLPNENTYTDPNKPNSSDRIPFPSISTPPSVDISLIVPAYNEEERLPKMMDDTLSYLRKRKQKEGGGSFTYEIIIVDDGSTDKTSATALQYVKRESVDSVRLLKLHKNRGKGGAVKRGMLCARGRRMLMVDADGATEIGDLGRLEDSARKVERDGLYVAVGSRAHLVASDVVAKRTLVRNILMHGFHFFVTIMGVKGIKDTQCGFKLFSRKSAHALFCNLHIERWAFDVELLYRARILKIPVVEVMVNWREIAGSKLSPISSSLQMAKDLTRIRVAYMIGIWKVSKPKSE